MTALQLNAGAAGARLRRYAVRNASLVLSYLVLAAMGLYYLSFAARHGQLSVFSITAVFNNTMPLLMPPSDRRSSCSPGASTCPSARSSA